MEPKILYIVVPCYNEEAVLPVTAPLFLEELQEMISLGKVKEESRILFVNDGSRDATWPFIVQLSQQDKHFIGISLSRNRGQQNAVLAGLMEAKGLCDMTVSIDCDGQDDITAIAKMVDEYYAGNEVVYGVRNNRDTDSWFKRFTAEAYYKLLKSMGVECVFNHADYRLMSRRVLEAFSEFGEVNLFLRGMVPLVGYKSTCVYYRREERREGKSHYPLKKMLALAADGVTSLSIKPIRIVTGLGIFLTMISVLALLACLIASFNGRLFSANVILGLTISFLSGLQIISIGVVGEYVGKCYLEAKHRPRYIISAYTWKE